METALDLVRFAGESAEIADMMPWMMVVCRWRVGAGSYSCFYPRIIGTKRPLDIVGRRFPARCGANAISHLTGTWTIIYWWLLTKFAGGVL